MTSAAAEPPLMDQRARTYDDEAPRPLNDRSQETLCGLGWVADADDVVVMPVRSLPEDVPAE